MDFHNDCSVHFNLKQDIRGNMKQIGLSGLPEILISGLFKYQWKNCTRIWVGREDTRNIIALFSCLLLIKVEPTYLLEKSCSSVHKACVYIKNLATVHQWQVEPSLSCCKPRRRARTPTSCKERIPIYSGLSI